MIPRGLRLIKDRNGRVRVKKVTFKMNIPLRVFEKKEMLTPRMVEYLEEYKKRISTITVIKEDGKEEKKILDVKTLQRIDAMLSKPRLAKDPILDFDYSLKEVRYTESHYRRMGYKGYDDWKKQDDERKAKEKEAQEKKLKEKENADAKK